jgi:hypothetical protein
MASKNTELYFDPVSQGNCEVLGCSNAAKYRASWAQGVIIKLVCPTHKMGVDGKLFEELGPSIFGSTRHAIQ